MSQYKSVIPKMFYQFVFFESFPIWKLPVTHLVRLKCCQVKNIIISGVSLYSALKGSLS